MLLRACRQTKARDLWFKPADPLGKAWRMAAETLDGGRSFIHLSAPTIFDAELE
jgi:hypothetical protein